MQNLQTIFPELYEYLIKGFTVPLRFTQNGDLVFVFSEDEDWAVGKITSNVISCTSHPATIYLYYLDEIPWAHSIEFWDHYS